ncbi:N-acetylmuramoyl-L-alanine amidase [Staphylococcus simiae]|uniref:Putative amidase, phage associated protein n=1 Tax=Staphylococcus simiae CCM 7213 = CCUG 51256 TaxID=911238 RepID=G5JHA5_9STAP|nr:N-acetylmuramoyl-L-alanine amidase [Staphylococcus simiae]EHJ08453.1 putative amidase, phage associated protein [Staphylococcus simiae CCM 7213 = CCUG 51256]PNZ12556.1 CHAP domain-containing protein [Staphylococcus simiae]SNV67555.1 putative amidase, phage associated [Staphylococcus simiae]
MTSIRTYQQAISYLKSLEGKAWNPDNAYGYQCFDTVNQYWLYLFGHMLKGIGAADIPTWNNFTNEATVYENTLSFQALPGDVVIFNRNYGQGYGHTGIVLSATLNSITILEQNWLGGAYWTPPEVTTRRTHGYDFPMWFIRPFYAKATTVNKLVSKATPVKKAKTNKGKKILLVAGHGKGAYSNDPGAVANGYNERDFNRKEIIPRVKKYLESVGNTVVLYGGKTMNQDLYQDTLYGQRVGNYSDYGLYWVKNNVKPDAIVEFHLDAASPQASGGHVIISDRFPADDIDKALSSALGKTVGKIRGVTPRNDLLNVNVTGQLNLNYRLIELGFITSKKDMGYITKNIDSFTKRIAEAINGRQINAPKSKPSKAKTTWNWKGTFYPNDTIKVRKSPGLSGTEVDPGSWLRNSNDWVPFDQVIKKDGYWWIRFKYQAPGSSDKNFYCAVTEITDKNQKIKNEKYWGKIEWK